MPALFAPRTVAPTAARPVRSVVLAASVACATWAAHSAPATSGTATTGSHITQVTLYPGSATVERSLRVPAGSRSVTFDCLAPGLDPASVQVRAEAPVRVGESSVQVLERALAPACASADEARWRAAQDDVASARAELQALELAHSYLKNTAGLPADSRAQRPAASGQIADTAEALRRSAHDNLQRQHQAQRRLELAELALKALSTERERLAGPQAKVARVSVTLASERDAELHLSYQVRGPSWSPSYRAHLDSSRAQVRLERLALVAQASGEDWQGVPLVLSTGQPSRSSSSALPRPWRLDLAPAVPPAPAPAAPAMARLAAAPKAALFEARSDDASAPSFEPTVLDSAYATRFQLPQRVDLPSGGARLTLTLEQHLLEAQLLTRVVPAQEEAAYLVAQWRLPTGIWPSANVALYRDGALVGQGQLDSEQLARQGLAFGRDERVRVSAEPVREHTGYSGLMQGTTERTVQRSYRIDNRHQQPITLQVLDAVPVPLNSQITTTSRYQPEPSDTAWNGDQGTLAWTLPLAAGASVRLEAQHTIRYAKELRVQERR